GDAAQHIGIRSVGTAWTDNANHAARWQRPRQHWLHCILREKCGVSLAARRATCSQGVISAARARRARHVALALDKLPRQALPNVSQTLPLLPGATHALHRTFPRACGICSACHAHTVATWA